MKIYEIKKDTWLGILFFAVICFISCTGGKETVRTSLATQFWSMDGISTQKSTIDLDGELNFCISVLSEGESVAYIFDKDKMRFDDLCRRYGDTAYSDKYSGKILSVGWFGSRFDDHCSFPAEPLGSVSLTCEEPWDDAHPAGASLADIACVTAFTAMPYISGGYQRYDWWGNEQSDRFMAMQEKDLRYHDSRYYPIDTMLEDLTSDDCYLMWHDKYICKILVPCDSSHKDKHLKVCVTDANDRQFSATVKVVLN